MLYKLIILFVVVPIHFPFTPLSIRSLWIPAQIVNFRVIPPNYTLLFSNCIGFIWNIYLSYKSNSKVDATSSTQSSSPSSAANAEVQVMKKA